MSKRIEHPWRSAQRGISIVMAIFLLLLFASIAAFMASLMSSSHISSAQDLEGSRAYQAARAGVEWGLYQLDAPGSVPGLPPCFATTTLTQIPNYSVNVTCTPYPGASTFYQEGSRTIRIFQVTATATSIGGRPPTVERVVEVIAEKCRDTLIGAPPYDC